MNATWIVLVTLLGLGLGTGDTPTDGPTDSDTGPSAAGSRFVVGWSQAADDAVGPGIVDDSEVIETEVERDDLLSRLPGSVATEEVEAVDLATHAVVVGGYHRCQESSRVVETTDGGYRLEVVPGDERVSCAWSPYAIDVWAVERPDATPEAGPTAGWSQDDDPDLVQDWRVEPATIGAPGELDALVASAPAGLRPQLADAVADVDLDREVVVIGGYADCLAHSEVDDDGTFTVVEEEPGAVCEWAPYRVDLYVLGR